MWSEKRRKEIEKRMKNEKIVMRFQSKDKKYNVDITHKALSKMEKLARRFYPFEVGSSLLGSYHMDGAICCIDNITRIPKGSKISTEFFERGPWDKKMTEYLNKRIWEGKNSENLFAGDWHSHINNFPEASEMDDIAGFAICKDILMNCPEFICLIINGKKENNEYLFQVGCFIYSRERGKIKLERK